MKTVWMIKTSREFHHGSIGGGAIRLGEAQASPKNQMGRLGEAQSFEKNPDFIVILYLISESG